MIYKEQLKKELMHDKVFKALYENLKKQDEEAVNTMLDELLTLASGAVEGFSTNFSSSNFSKEEIESAINDKTGRKT